MVDLIVRHVADCRDCCLHVIHISYFLDLKLFFFAEKKLSRFYARESYKRKVWTSHHHHHKHALGNEFRAKHVAKRGSNLKVGRVENYRDETSVRVRKGRDGLGE